MKPFDPSSCHITLPCDKAGLLTGKAMQIEGALIAKRLADPTFKFPGMEFLDRYLKADGKTFKYTCPHSMAFTDTAHYPRIEWRGHVEKAFNEKMVHKIDISIDELPEGKKVVFQQYHDEDRPWVKMVAERKLGRLNIRGLVKVGDGDKEVSIDLRKDKTSLALGERFISEIVWFPPDGLKKGYMRMRINDDLMKRQEAIHTGKSGKVYPKDGLYVQFTDLKDAVVSGTRYA